MTINLLPEKQRDNHSVTQVYGVAFSKPVNAAELQVAVALDRFLRERPHLSFDSGSIKKAYAVAVTLCPACYIDPETLSWDAELSEAVVEKAIMDAVKLVSASRPRLPPTHVRVGKS